MTKKAKPKATGRVFRVWLDKHVVGCETSYEMVEMPAGASDEECEEACADTLQTMIGNELDTGWEEVKDE